MQAVVDGRCDRFDDLWRNVFRRDEVDVVATASLQRQHHAGDVLRRRSARRRSRFDRLADVVVLAEHASQVAVREEDGARSVPAAQTILLAEVRERAADDGVAAGFAGGPAILESVHTAVARTRAAVGERRDRALDARLKLTAIERQVCRTGSSTHRCRYLDSVTPGRPTRPLVSACD